jgi:uncharacterized protein YcfJ
VKRSSRRRFGRAHALGYTEHYVQEHGAVLGAAVGAVASTALGFGAVTAVGAAVGAVVGSAAGLELKREREEP